MQLPVSWSLDFLQAPAQGGAAVVSSTGTQETSILAL